MFDMEKHGFDATPRAQLPHSISTASTPRQIRLKKPSRLVLGLASAVLLLIWHVYLPGPHINLNNSPPCAGLPLSSDTVLIMKTGVTEIRDRFPVHAETTLKCATNLLIYSDHEELYQGKYPIRDVFANVDPMVKWKNDDFALWRHVNQVGREGLQAAEITGQRSSSKTTKEDKIGIAGWVLDKWKFLPMINETFHVYPDKKWYVFMESDTYLFWSTTLKFLSTLDHTTPLVLGHRSTVKSEHPFMHGGSGYMISNAAMRTAVAYINSHRTDLDEFVASEWAGDIALGLVFKEAGIPLQTSWPMYQPHYFGMIDFSVIWEDKSFWCTPVGSYHHMTSDDIEDMFYFEQEWIRENNKKDDPYTVLHHGDVFNAFVLPRMRMPRVTDWDNQSNAVRDNATTVEECKKVCFDDVECLQYMFDPRSQKCTTMDTVRLGEVSVGSGLYSDWIFERLERWRDELPPCYGDLFISPVSDGSA